MLMMITILMIRHRPLIALNDQSDCRDWPNRVMLIESDRMIVVIYYLKAVQSPVPVAHKSQSYGSASKKFPATSITCGYDVYEAPVRISVPAPLLRPACASVLVERNQAIK